MSAGYIGNVTTVTLPDPAAASLVTLIVKAPAVGAKLQAAYASCSAAIASHATNIVTVEVLDGGSDGTGTTSMGSFGGASTAWAAGEANALTLTQTGVDGGDHLMFKYSEGGTVAPGYVTLTLEWTPGGS